MSESNLHLNSLQKATDIEKDIPIASPDIVVPGVLEEKEPLSLKTADLWRNKLYTVIPAQHDLSQGITPEDQRFSRKYVFLWDDYSSLNIFSDTRWRKVVIYLPKGLKDSHQLTKMMGDVYALPEVPASWRIEEQPLPPTYVQ